MADNYTNQIINFLLTQKDYISSSTISDVLELNPRTVKYAIEQLTSNYPNLFETNKKGVLLKQYNLKLIENILKSNIENDKGTKERRVNILTQLLTTSKPLSLIDFANNNFISQETLTNEITSIKKNLIDYNINLYIKANFIHLEGSVIDKRRLLLDILEQNMSYQVLNIDMIQRYVKDIDLAKLQDLTLKTVDKYKFSIDKYSLINFVIHLAVLISFSVEHTNFIYETHKQKTDKDNLEIINNISQEIYQECKKLYPNNHFTHADIYDICFLMFTRLTPINIETLSTSDIDNLLGKDISKLLNEITDSIYNTYAIDLHVDTFISRFGLHLKNLCLRIENNKLIDNKLFGNFKKEYPLLFAISVNIASIINRRMKTNLTEDEIILISLYIGIIMEENKSNQNKLNCLLFTPDYFTIRRALVDSITEHFSSQLVICNITDDINNVSNLDKNMDLIITTVDLSNIASLTPIIQVNPLLGDKDIQKIQTFANNCNSLKARKIVKNQIKHFFNKNLFYTNTSFTQDKQVIDFICKDMEKHGYVNEKFIDEIYEHESICPSSYGHVAIAHPLNGYTDKSAISVLIQNNPVDWGENKVNIVFIFTLAQVDKNLFSDIFSLIIHLVNDKQCYDKLISCKTFADFIDLIIKYA